VAGGTLDVFIHGFSCAAKFPSFVLAILNGILAVIGVWAISPGNKKQCARGGNKLGQKKK
jgi:hypothetical protein